MYLLVPEFITDNWVWYSHHLAAFVSVFICPSRDCKFIYQCFWPRLACDVCNFRLIFSSRSWTWDLGSLFWLSDFSSESAHILIHAHHFPYQIMAICLLCGIHVRPNCVHEASWIYTLSTDSSSRWRTNVFVKFPVACVSLHKRETSVLRKN